MYIRCLFSVYYCVNDAGCSNNGNCGSDGYGCSCNNGWDIKPDCSGNSCIFVLHFLTLFRSCNFWNSLFSKFLSHFCWLFHTQVKYSLKHYWLHQIKNIYSYLFVHRVQLCWWLWLQQQGNLHKRNMLVSIRLDKPFRLYR